MIMKTEVSKGENKHFDREHKLIFEITMAQMDEFGECMTGGGGLMNLRELNSWDNLHKGETWYTSEKHPRSRETRREILFKGKTFGNTSIEAR